MPKKPNSSGELQEYIPAGNGDASGEYGDADGNNKHFTNFVNPHTDKSGLVKDANNPLTNQNNDVKIKPNLNNSIMQDLEAGIKAYNIEYREVQAHKKPLTEEEIIKELGGGDMTKGSCASLALAYIGQKGGLDVLDFRDGASRRYFATTLTLKRISQLPGVKSVVEKAKSEVTAGNMCLKSVEIGKEYLLSSGKHAAIVRRTSAGELQYLELQSPTNNGWHNFNKSPRATLQHRFGDFRFYGYDVESFMIDVESLKNSSDLHYLLGYINTSRADQRKGQNGTIK